MRDRIGPFLKWAGGKTQLLPVLAEMMPASYGRYFEPFIGGGALLFHERPRAAVISDVNPQLINVYRQIRDDAERVIAILRELDAPACGRARYLAMRDRYNRLILAGADGPECAALAVWINKRCYNGLYRVNSKGLFNVPYNNRTAGPSVNEDNLRAAGRYLRENDVTILRADFAEACAAARAGDFVYFDSPYVPAGVTARFTDYTRDGFAAADHERLARLFRELDAKGVKLMLSNNDVPAVRELYRGYAVRAVSVRRAINSDAAGREGSEVIVTNY